MKECVRHISESFSIGTCKAQRTDSAVPVFWQAPPCSQVCMEKDIMMILAMFYHCRNEIVLHSIVEIQFLIHAEIFVTLQGIFFPIPYTLIPIFPDIFVFPFFIHIAKAKLFHKPFLMIPERFIPASNESSAVLPRAFGECREGL